MRLDKHPGLAVDCTRCRQALWDYRAIAASDHVWRRCGPQWLDLVAPAVPTPRRL